MNIRKIKLLLINKLFGNAIGTLYKTYVYNSNPKNYLKAGEHIMLARPLYVFPELIELESYTRLQADIRAIISKRQKIIIKKYSAIGAGVTIIPGNHVPTVTSPQYLSYVGVNDVNNQLVIAEDVWIGANSTLLYKGGIGRGAVVAANSVVTKKIPPYAVVSGIPAKVIAVRFSLEQIIEHEKSLYPQEERMDISILKNLFEKEYAGLRTIGTDMLSEIDSYNLSKEKKRLRIMDCR